MIVFDSEYIDNINNAMIMIFPPQYDLFGKELVIEDGRITQVYTGEKIIRKMPESGADVYVDYEKFGTLKQEYAGIPSMDIFGRTVSVRALPFMFPDKSIMFSEANVVKGENGQNGKN